VDGVPRKEALAVGAAALVAVAGGVLVADGSAKPRVTNRCPVDALPLRNSDLPALRRFGVALAPHGVHRMGSQTADYRQAEAKAGFPTFYTGFVRSACPPDVAKRVIARTADVSVGYPRINWSASLSSSTFLVARTPHGLVGWAQMH
jgi:hypothetical protein